MDTVSQNIVVADDHALILEGMVSLLGKLDGVGSVSSAVDGRQALDFLIDQSIDIVILDINLPGLSGVDVAREIRKRKLSTRIILMTGEVSEDRAAVLINELSLDAFLFKTSNMNQFEQAVRAVLNQDSFFPPDVTDALNRVENAAMQLSNREVQVVRMIGEGHTSESAANVLGISPHTVRKHRENIKRKLGIGTVAELSSYAHRNQLF
ncbi:response regulator transcription factor [Kordiimonas aquimaris]|uniref:response regulator transcription factor n=1 Tax=Kordiimonas aquimaris TaxID=707591 RepID=UPI0021D38E97|nr:response regulator transcription factor [Kordiimonas aquimaris]